MQVACGYLLFMLTDLETSILPISLWYGIEKRQDLWQNCRLSHCRHSSMKQLRMS